MTDSGGWFEGIDLDDPAAVTQAIIDGQADQSGRWPQRAIEAGVVENEDEYYQRLHDATTTATEQAVTRRERADDQQLMHLLRARDDCVRHANELAERVSEWGGSRLPETGTGVEYAQAVATGDIETTNPRLQSLATRCVDLRTEADELTAAIEQQAPSVAPNLTALAGTILAARLIELAGGLEALAKLPSSTVQVLGAEDALFAHLRGNAPSPKHGVIYTHEAIQGTHPDHRGSAARALAGKLTIAARIDHYAGDRRPKLEAELAERIETIQQREGTA